MLHPIITLVGGVVAVAIGIADAWSKQRLGLPLDTVLIVGGVTSLGVHVGTH